MKTYLTFLKELEPEFKRNTLFISIAFFFALFSYPFTRSVTQSLFYDFYTAQDYSLATFFSVLALIIVIYFSNKFQEMIGAQKLLAMICALAVALFGVSYFLLNQGQSSAAFYMFAVKESYIVLLIHLILAYANSVFSLEQIKRLSGPLGAIGSIGGVIGGQLTSFVSGKYGVLSAFSIGLFGIAMCAITFMFTKRIILTRKEAMESSPLKSVKNVKKYVFLIAAIVAVSQWVIFIADLQFNMVFESAFETKSERASYLGNLYSMVNGFSLLIQFVILPWLMIKVSNKKIFFAVPLFFLILILGGFGLGAGSLLASATVFVSLKGADYSVFNAAKEVMYYPLDRMQKFGAKYITDMFIYRLSKALIAFLMARVLLEYSVFKNVFGLTVLQSFFIILWVILLITLLKEQINLNKEVSEKL